MAKFCGNCGNMASDEARVCGVCGTPFVAETAPAPVQYEQPQPYYQQMPLTPAPAPAPKKSKKGLVIGGVVAIIAIIVAVVIAISSSSSSGNGSSKGEEEAKNTAKSVASKAASYVVDGDANGLVNYVSQDMIDFACDAYGLSENNVKGVFRDEYETYTEYVNELKQEGYKVTYEVLDYEESPELEEIQGDVGDQITEVYIYTAEFSFEDPDGDVEKEELEIMVWKNDGEWEFVAVRD